MRQFAEPTLLTVVTVTGEPSQLSRWLPASVTVVSDEQVTNAHALTSADIMRTVPLVDLKTSGSTRYLSTVTIHGGKP